MSPRGNDSEAAGQELKARTGVAPNAEEMIAANQARWPTELMAANNRAVDSEATDDLSDDEVQGLVGDDQTVLGHAVRGPFVVTVSEDDETGEIVKKAHPRPGHEKQAERLAPKEMDPEKADKEAQKRAEKEAKEREVDEDVATPEGAAEEQGEQGDQGTEQQPHPEQQAEKPKSTATPAAARRR
jgi:hypothetical protein